ncbi:hypothetical protein OUZ56_003427 [Daphnia magna]|uniref:Uncharacterized protein n=1 Tax=Daphnia magna TaxID=35525 RepID=A0ABR0A8N1_9CRUS|nr:hypothetical protein OUZ56_003427 [Daphnia magna]
MGKLPKLWNRYNRSTLASDTVHSVFGCQLKTPGETRWNSKFDAVEDILSKDRAKLDELMLRLQLETLDEEDRILLNEFLLAMKPIAVYLPM